MFRYLVICSFLVIRIRYIVSTRPLRRKSRVDEFAYAIAAVATTREKFSPPPRLEICCCGLCTKGLEALPYSAKCKLYLDHKSREYVFTQKKLSLRRRRWHELIRNYELRNSVPPEKGDMGTGIGNEGGATRAIT